MRKSMYALSVAAMAAIFALPSAVQAHDSSKQRDERGQMKGSGTMGQMSQMMDHCSRMMQDSSSAAPNEQWRDGGTQSGDHTDRQQ